MGQAHQALTLPGQGHARPRPRARVHHTAHRVNEPPQAPRGGDHVAPALRDVLITVRAGTVWAGPAGTVSLPGTVLAGTVLADRGALQPQALALGPPPAPPGAGEDHHAPVGQRQPGGVPGKDQAHLGPRGPAPPEGTHHRVQRAVGARPRQGPARPGEAQILLDLQEGARTGVDRVVAVARGGRGPVGRGRVDHDVRTLAGHARTGQDRLHGTVRQGGHLTAASRVLKGLSHGLGPLGILFVGQQPLPVA